jgi:hypothetical protein
MAKLYSLPGVGGEESRKALSVHRENALQALDRMHELTELAYTEIETGQKFYYWEPKLIELINLVQALRLSCDMIFREQNP